MRRTSLIATAIMISSAALGQWFPTPLPYTVTNSPTIDPNSHAELNADFASLVSQGNAGQATLLASITSLGPIGLPAGAVVFCGAGYAVCPLNGCPTGYQAANGTNGTADVRGVYIRGLDTGGSVDPGRSLASYQGDTFQQHSHGSINTFASITSYSSQMTTQSPNGQVIDAESASASPDTTGSITSGVAGNTETRPYSIVLVACEVL
jgi:hypothetical protein